MDTLLTIVHVVVCFCLVGIVLLQHGKGADIGATFGGSSQSLFGTEGPLPLLNKITTIVAIIFMLTSVSLAYIASQQGTSSVMLDAPELSQPVAAPDDEAKVDTTAAAKTEGQVLAESAVQKEESQPTQVGVQETTGEEKTDEKQP